MQALLQFHNFTPGTRVTCAYRMPSESQPWIHPVYVGIVVKVKGYIGFGNVLVRYSFGVMRESADSLTATDKKRDYML